MVLVEAPVEQVVVAVDQMMVPALELVELDLVKDGLQDCFSPVVIQNLTVVDMVDLLPAVAVAAVDSKIAHRCSLSNWFKILQCADSMGHLGGDGGPGIVVFRYELPSDYDLTYTKATGGFIHKDHDDDVVYHVFAGPTYAGNPGPSFGPGDGMLQFAIQSGESPFPAAVLIVGGGGGGASADSPSNGLVVLVVEEEYCQSRLHLHRKYNM